MNAIKIIEIVIGVIGLVLLVIAAGRALERRWARKLVSPLLGRPCPSCATPFQPDAVRRARLEHPFDGPNYASLLCRNCSKRFALIADKLVELPL